MIAADHDFVTNYLAGSAEALQTYAADPAQLELLGLIAECIVAAMRAGGRLLIAGNGGSAGDAQHIAGEFTGRMLYNREPLPALALTTDTSTLTAIGNDYGFEKVFERQILGLGRPGDVFMGMSTSGNSSNILRGLHAAKLREMRTIGFTGQGKGAMVDCTELLLCAPSTFTPVIQQIHMVAAHMICSLVERAMFPKL